MSFADRFLIFAGLLCGALESRKSLRVKLSVIRDGARECFGKARWL
jgi:hypothetical protein